MPTTTRTSRLLGTTCALLAAASLPAPPAGAAAIDPPWQSFDAAVTPADDPMVGVDADGTATLVWTEGGSLFAATRPAGGHFGFPHQVAGVTGADVLAFAEAPSGAAVVAWTDVDRHRVVASRRPAGAADFGAPVAVSGPGSVPGDYFLDAAVGADGTVALSWRRQVGETTKVQAAVARDDGGFVVSTLDTSTDTAVVVENPDVGVDGAGRVVTVWDRTAQQGVDRLYAAIDQGAGFVPQVVAEVAQGPTFPSIAVAGDGGAVVAYQDFESARLAVRTGDLATGDFGPQQGLLGNEQGVVSYETAIDDTGRAAVLASYIDQSDYKVGASVSDTGGSFGGLADLTSADQVTGPGISEDELAVSAAAPGEFAAFWETDGDGSGVANQAWSATTTGGTFGAPARLSEAGVGVEEVTGTAGPDGAVVAAWTTERADAETIAQAYPVTADTTAPVLRNVTATPPVVHRGDRWKLSFVPSEEVQATVRIVDARGRAVTTLARNALLADGDTAHFSWSGKVDGQRVRAGTYRFVVKAVDVGGNPTRVTGRFEVRS